MGSRRGRGEGGIEQHGEKWRAWFSHTVDGVRHRPSKVFDRKREALEWLAERRRESQDHAIGLPAACPLTVAEWLRQWLALRKPNVERKTQAFYEACIGAIIPHVDGTLLVDLTSIEVESIYARLAATGIGTNTRRKAALTFRQALRAAVKRRLIASNPADDVAAPKHRRREIKPLTGEQVRAFLAAASGTWLESFWRLALDTGARPGELLALRWDAIDWERGAVSILFSLSEVSGRMELKQPKTKAGRRTIRIAQSTLDSLARTKERAETLGRFAPGGFIHSGQRNDGWIASSVLHKSYFLPILKRSGIPKIRIYDLRHTCATQLLLAGVPVHVVSARLGHASIQITLDHYAHVLPANEEQAVRAIEKLLE